MLDKKNSLLTAVSDEECATVRGGGDGFTVNPDGTLTFTSSSTGIFLGKILTVNSLIKFDPTAANPTISLGASEPTSSPTPSSPDPNNNVSVSLTPK